MSNGFGFDSCTIFWRGKINIIQFLGEKSTEFHRKSLIGNSVVGNGVSHSDDGPLSKFKHSNPPAVSVVTFSADVATLYREQKDPEKMENLEELSEDFDENSGFAIIINGHSLSHCLSPELEARFDNHYKSHL